MALVHQNPVVFMAPTFDASPLVFMDAPGIFFDVGPAAGGGRKGIMIQLALKLAGRSIGSMKNLAASIKTGLTGNASFPAPTTTPVMLQTAIDNVTAVEAALTTAEEVVTMRREDLGGKVQALQDVLNAVGVECLDKVKTLPEADARMKLMSANLILKSDGAPVAEVAAPQNFHLSQGDHSGEVDGGCNRVANAKMYRVRCGASMAGPFVTKYEGTKSSFTIAGLALGVCWFQMAAFGTNGGWSEWSDPATVNVV